MARRQVQDAERAALRAWIEIAKTRPGEPLPDQAIDTLREVAAVVSALTMSALPSTKAAKAAATWAGLTGVAIADFRSEQDDLRTAACLMFNTHSEYRTPRDKVVSGPVLGNHADRGIADKVSDVSARQAFRRRARVLGTKNRQ
jgi:hypothetical protein